MSLCVCTCVCVVINNAQNGAGKWPLKSRIQSSLFRPRPRTHNMKLINYKNATRARGRCLHKLKTRIRPVGCHTPAAAAAASIVINSHDFWRQSRNPLYIQIYVLYTYIQHNFKCYLNQSLGPRLCFSWAENNALITTTTTQLSQLWSIIRLVQYLWQLHSGRKQLENCRE